MAARLFDTVVVYNTPGTTDITPAPGEDAQIDLAAIGNDVTVHFAAAAASDRGKAIGVTLLSDSAFSVGYTDAVDVLVSSIIFQAADCELFTWDPTAGAWHMVGAFRRSALVLSGGPVVYTPVDNTPIETQPGQYVQVSLASATDNVPLQLPTRGIPGQLLAVRVTAGYVDADPALSFAYALEPPGLSMRFRGDFALFVCTSLGTWETLVQQSGIVAQSFTRSFQDGSLSGSDLAVAHFLNCVAPNLAIWDDTGALVPPGASTWTAVQNNPVSVTVTFNALLLPLSGTWTISATGAPTAT